MPSVLPFLRRVVHTVDMAKKMTVTLIDDLNGGPATETIEFGIDGVTYEVDLNAENAEELRGFLVPYITPARRVGGRKKSTTSSARRSDLDDIRAWGRANGYRVSDRGRVSADVIDAYDKRNQGRDDLDDPFQ